jgi:glycosyltransferase involved in cell wall biosynthesis
MRICYVSPEIFHWGVHGGFGYLTRVLAKEVAKRGHEVSVITPRKMGQGAVEEIDGFRVYGFRDERREIIGKLFSRMESSKLYRRVDAQIYHSQAVSYNTLFAQKARSDSYHIITFQDPFDIHEWKRISQVDERYKQNLRFKFRFMLERHLLASCCHWADGLYSQARFLIPKSIILYNLKRKPEFLPNPVYPSNRIIRKTPEPTVCFLARWDPQKRVEIFFKMAKLHPEINFIAMGHSHSPSNDRELRKRYGNIPNLSLTGFVSEEEKSEILGKSWALINTSIREALPVSFLEALAHETPIISGENPDNLTRRYGYHVIDDYYSSGLREMLTSDDWSEKGKQGRRLIERVYSVDKVVDRHIEIYESLLRS